MSFVSWHTYGYGVKVSDIRCDSVKRLQTLLHCAPNYEKEINAWLESNEIKCPSLEEYYEYDQYYCLGLASLMQQVILEAEDIEFTACDDFEGDTYLLFEPSYPWNLRVKEARLIEKDIFEILTKYISMLTDAVVPIDYYAPENGG